jgi:hypothetical protein
MQPGATPRAAQQLGLQSPVAFTHAPRSSFHIPTIQPQNTVQNPVLGPPKYQQYIARPAAQDLVTDPAGPSATGERHLGGRMTRLDLDLNQRK